jgi:hypothetical protein
MPTTPQSQPARRSRRPAARKRFSERFSAQAERVVQLQLGAVLRAKDAMTATSPATIRKRVERELTTSERRGAAGQKAISRELQRRREQLARITRRGRATA